MPCVCSQCGRVLKEFNRLFLCNGCLSQLKMSNNGFMIREEFSSGSLPIYNPLNTGFDICFYPCIYEGLVRDMIHGLKYKDKRNTAYTMAAMIWEIIDKSNVRFDLIVPVPIHNKRLKMRGYNQSALIAQELSNLMKVPHSNAIKRIRDTPSQVLFNGDMRWYNVRDAFECITNLEGKSVLLVDDVITTGATMCFCALQLKDAGAKIVGAAAFAGSV
ncbi:MAG: ComF family protein [Clostridiales bacterium]|jgi:competence protein ComFC|nr:ComF family protein [Clostridiales bacterium]